MCVNRFGQLSNERKWLYGHADLMGLERSEVMLNAIAPLSTGPAATISPRRARSKGDFSSLSWLIADSRDTSPVERQQLFSDPHQVRQREQRVQLRRVLRHAPATHLAIPEALLDHLERMLRLGADDRLELLQRLRPIQLAPPPG